MDQRPLERVWVGYFLCHRTLKIPLSINKRVSGSKIVGKTERKKALNFESWFTSEHFLLHQLHWTIILMSASSLCKQTHSDRFRLMLWISYRNFSYHHAIRLGPVERIAARFLPHSKRLDDAEAEFHLPYSQLLNLIFPSQKMKREDLFKNKVSSTCKSSAVSS